MVAYRRNVIPGVRYFFAVTPADRATRLLVNRVVDPRAEFGAARMQQPLDGDGRVASFTLNGYPRTITYDAANRITDLTDALSQSFSYDNLDRLTSYTAFTANQTFSYDAVGNRTQLTDGANSDSYTYASTSNRLTAIAGSHTKSYSYTANGNISNDGSHNYIYDARNRLVSVDYGTTYTLNGLGQRIKKDSGIAQNYAAGDANGDGAFTAADGTTILNQILQTATATGNPDCNQDGQVNVQDLVCLNIRIAGGATPATGGTVVFAYDEQGQLIGEYDQIGAAIEETVYLGKQPVAVLKQGNVYYIHTDQLNTPRVISDTTDKVIWRWDSDPFGTTAAVEDPDLDGVKFTYNLRFPGQYYDKETNLNYNYYRDYDPSTGRYIESDPIGLEGGINTYTYVRNNPLNRIDPFGLKEYPDDFIGPLQSNDYHTSQMTQTKCGRIPPAPPGTDIDQNIRDARNHYNLLWFYNQVRNKGPWDYKQRGPLYQDFGNYNYGATGQAFGFPQNLLRRAAGWANQKADPSRANLGSPWGGPPYGDDPADQEQINNGMNYCECMERSK